MEVNLIGGLKYLLLLKDNFSNYCMVYFLKKKLDTITYLHKFITMVSNQTSSRIKIIRSNNGIEFINNKINKLFDNNSILRQVIVPYSPQQNGRIEREMRTVVEMTRIMIHSQNLTMELWAKAVNYAVYILNCTSKVHTIDKTPLKLWMNEDIKLDNFIIFGEEVHVHIQKEK